MDKQKDLLKVGLKTTLGVALVYYVVHSRMVDFEDLKSVIFNPRHLLLAAIFLGFSWLCCAIRWFLLVRAQGLSPTFKDILSLTMIGNFFNTFMPGAVGGDFIKAWYIAGREPKRRTKAVLTVFVDRVVGLAVIIFYSAFTLFFFPEWISIHPDLQWVAWAVWIFTGSSMAIAFLFFFPPLWKNKWVTKMITFLQSHPTTANVAGTVIHYRHHLPTIVFSIALSALSVLGTNFLYYFLGQALGVPLTLAQYFFIVPLGLTFSAIPLLPGGIGTGQVAFFTLFRWMGVGDAHLGGTLCTVLQIYTILLNCVGGVFYLRFKRIPHIIPSIAL